jgi:8-oxo-dGTP pyrophosphatase MutT (NUDIX family)
MTRWKQLKSRYLIKRWWMNVREDHVRLPNGHEMEEYHVLEYPDWVCVVCLTEESELVLVEQYRYGIDETTLELPSGVIETREEPLEAAKRELLEETGYVSPNWTLVGKAAPDPSRHTNWAWFYFASEAKVAAPQSLDPGEHLVVCRMPLEDAMAAAAEGRIAHGVHLTALFWADRVGLLDGNPAVARPSAND